MQFDSHTLGQKKKNKKKSEKKDHEKREKGLHGILGLIELDQRWQLAQATPRPSPLIQKQPDLVACVGKDPLGQYNQHKKQTYQGGQEFSSGQLESPEVEHVLFCLGLKEELPLFALPNFLAFFL